MVEFTGNTIWTLYFWGEISNLIFNFLNNYRSIHSFNCILNLSFLDIFLWLLPFCQSFQITGIEFLHSNLLMDIAISSLSLILVSSFPTLISGIYLFYKLSSKNILTRTSVLNRFFLQLQYTHKKEYSRFINILLYFLLISLLCYYFLPSCVFFIFGIILFHFLFIYFWLHWVFIAVCGISLVATSESYSLVLVLSLQWLLLLQNTGSRALRLP